MKSENSYKKIATIKGCYRGSKVGNKLKINFGESIMK